MIGIIAFLFFAFVIAGIVGLRLHSSSAWNYVDVMYYPLAAIGVALLFANNSAQRQLFELGRLADKHKAELQAIVSTKPDVRVVMSGELVDSSFSLIATISSIGAACGSIPKVDPQCIVADRLKGSVGTFLEVAEAKYASPELRLSSACSAAERLLDDIRTKEEISSLISDELIAQYKIAISKNYNSLAYDSVSAEAQAFEQRALGKIDWLHNTVLKDDSEPTKLVLAIDRSEVDFGKTILQGLYPCIVAPKKDLDLLAKWTISRQSEEEEIKKISQDLKRMKESNSGDPVLLWIQLNLWPLVLITALSLKFAKGAAVLQKSKPRTNMSMAHGPEEDSPLPPPPVPTGNGEGETD